MNKKILIYEISIWLYDCEIVRNKYLLCFNFTMYYYIILIILNNLREIGYGSYMMSIYY